MNMGGFRRTFHPATYTHQYRPKAADDEEPDNNEGEHLFKMCPTYPAEPSLQA